MPREVIVTPYDPRWADAFARESARLSPLFTPLNGVITHIGSTAVPGLAAKPIIDILIEVDDIRAVDDLNPGMVALGYQPRGENGIPGRRYFARIDGETHTHHIHVFAAGSPNAARHLALRDYLRTHPAALRQYGELKQALARQYPYDIDAYVAGKDALVKTLEQAALGWKAG